MRCRLPGHVAVVLLLMSSAACGPAAPSISSQQRVPPPPTPVVFPPLSGPARTYVFNRSLSTQVADYTKQSRFVLYDNGGFALIYEGLGEYRGGYTASEGTLQFNWEGWSTAGAWYASGTLQDDILTVNYNLIMQLTDFEDAIYVLQKD